MKKHLTLLVLATLLVTAIAPAGPSARAEWTAINLHPADVGGDSWAFGVSGGQQVGVVGAGGGSRASLWSGTAASWVDLSPAGFDHSDALGVGGGQQVGSAAVNLHAHAGLWSGTAASWVDLSPSGSPDSVAHGVGGGQQVGQAIVNGFQRAGMWSGTAASWVDLTPAGLFGGVAYRISGGQQVGYVHNSGGFVRASLWSGTAASWVDLTPAGSMASQAYDVSGGQQVGYAYDGAQFRASLWSGTAASWVDLNPAGSPDSEARGVFDGQQVGYAQVGGVPHAGLWSGAAASWVDLHAFVPAGFSESVAQSIWRDANFTYVAGYGYNGDFQRALLWTHPVPEPASFALLAIGALFLCWRKLRPQTRSVYTALALFAPTPLARADIFQWEYINPADPSQGKQQSTTLAPDGASVNAVPGANLTFRDLTMGYLIGADLTGAYGEAVILTDADLSQANLTNAHFTGYADDYGVYFTDLSGANLTQANLTNANLAGTTLINANFSQANLTNAHFDDADLTGANLTGAEVRSGNFTRYSLGSGITTAQLQSTASYQAHDLTGIVLAGNNLAGVNLAGQNLTNAKFEIIFSPAANLTGANLSQSNLTNADFSYVTLTAADLTGAEVRGAKFFHSQITAAQLYSTASYQAHDLRGFKLNGNHEGLNLASQNLANADFHGANLTNSNLSQANLTGADFSVFYDPYYGGWETNLTGANLSQANLTNAKFSGYSYSIYDENIGEVVIIIPGANLTGANLTGAYAQANFQYATLSGADTRGANFNFATLAGANTSNLIQSDGHIAGLDLTSGASLVVRDYDGNPAASPPTGPLPIVVEQHLAMNATGALRLVFDADAWDSTISFTAGIPVALGGTLELAFAPGVNVATQSSRTIDLFDWTGVTPTGAFTVSSPYTWDLSNLYTTGEVTLAALPALPGDYNGNGVVDAADYTVWRDTLGDLPSYNFWKSHFGQTAGSPAAPNWPTRAVPEPASLALCVSSLGAISSFVVRKPWRVRRPYRRLGRNIDLMRSS